MPSGRCTAQALRCALVFEVIEVAVVEAQRDAVPEAREVGALIDGHAVGAHFLHTKTNRTHLHAELGIEDDAGLLGFGPELDFLGLHLFIAVQITPGAEVIHEHFAAERFHEARVEQRLELARDADGGDKFGAVAVVAIDHAALLRGAVAAGARVDEVELLADVDGRIARAVAVEREEIFQA